MREMESQTPPSKIARLSYPSIGETGRLKNMDRHGSSGVCTGSPPIGLGLALGSDGSSDHRPRPTPTPGCTKSYGFTVLQLHELQLQSLIYKYIESGFPVPYHLLLPIWKSLSSSLNSSLYQLYPSLMRSSIPLHLDYRKSMDPEPGRCRRTDGKKWRCSKETLPDQKYCERHMHRGRHRSRKFVEPPSSQTISASTNLSISLPEST